MNKSIVISERYIKRQDMKQSTFELSQKQENELYFYLRLIKNVFFKKRFLVKLKMKYSKTFRDSLIKTIFSVCYELLELFVNDLTPYENVVELNNFCGTTLDFVCYKEYEKEYDFYVQNLLQNLRICYYYLFEFNPNFKPNDIDKKYIKYENMNKFIWKSVSDIYEFILKMS